MKDFNYIKSLTKFQKIVLVLLTLTSIPVLDKFIDDAMAQTEAASNAPILLEMLTNGIELKNEARKHSDQFKDVDDSINEAVVEFSEMSETMGTLASLASIAGCESCTAHLTLIKCELDNFADLLRNLIPEYHLFATADDISCGEKQDELEKFYSGDLDGDGYIDSNEAKIKGRRLEPIYGVAIHSLLKESSKYVLPNEDKAELMIANFNELNTLTTVIEFEKFQSKILLEMLIEQQKTNSMLGKSLHIDAISKSISVPTMTDLQNKNK